MKHSFACGLMVAMFSVACAVNAADTASSATPHYVWAKQKGESSRIVGSSSVPPWKGYAQLSAQEKDLVRAGYRALGPNDEPPYPVAGTQTLIRAVQREVVPESGEGVLHLVATVNAAGTVEQVAIKNSPDAATGVRLAALLKRSAFKPARCQGEPCAMDYPLVLTIAP